MPCSGCSALPGVNPNQKKWKEMKNMFIKYMRIALNILVTEVITKILPSLHQKLVGLGLGGMKTNN